MAKSIGSQMRQKIWMGKNGKRYERPNWSKWRNVWKNTTKNVYKAEEVGKGKIENSQRPIKSRPLLPLLTCGTSYPLPRGKRHQRLHSLAPASRTWAGNAAMIRWSEIWENRELKRVGETSMTTYKWRPSRGIKEGWLLWCWCPEERWFGGA